MKSPPPEMHLTRRTRLAIAAGITVVIVVGGAASLGLRYLIEARRFQRLQTMTAEAARLGELPRAPSLPRPDVAESADLNDPRQWREAQSQARDWIPRLRRVTVAVASPSANPHTGDPPYQSNFASGTIISADGLVLSQAHVSHAAVGGRDGPAAGDKTTVILSDGSNVDATLLGHNADYDLSLLQLDAPGVYPFAPLADGPPIEIGDWVIKMGHPEGYRSDRPAPARLGRVIASDGETIVTDCVCVGGDSGGGFFDLQGQLVAVFHSKVTDNALGYWSQVPRAEKRQWRDLSRAVSTQRVEGLLPAMQSGETVGEQYAYRPAGGLDFLHSLQSLPWRFHLRSESQKRRFAETSRSRFGDVVPIRGGTVVTGYATVINEEGLAVAEAASLVDRPWVRHQGRELPVDVAGLDSATGLAVLRLPIAGLRPWKFEEAEVSSGTFVASVSPGGTIGTIAAITVDPRTYDRGRSSPETDERQPAAPLAVHGEPRDDGFKLPIGDWPVAAGLRSGDMVVRVADRSVRTADDIASATRMMRPGDLVKVTVQRDGHRTTLITPLPPTDGMLHQLVSVSPRRDGYEGAMEFAPPIDRHSLGGPLVNLDGRPVGVVVARLGDHAGVAVPAEALTETLRRYANGELLPE